MTATHRFQIKYPIGWGHHVTYRGSKTADERATIDAVWTHMQALERSKGRIISARIWRVRRWWFDERVCILTLADGIAVEDHTSSGWGAP